MTLLLAESATDDLLPGCLLLVPRLLHLLERPLLLEWPLLLVLKMRPLGLSSTAASSLSVTAPLELQLKIILSRHRSC